MLQYFQCDWIIEPEVRFSELLSIGSQLNVEIHISTIIENSNGFYILPISIEIKDTGTLEKFNEKFGQKAGMSSWFPISDEIYLAGISLSGWLSGELEPELRLVGKWLEIVKEKAHRNYKLRRKNF